MNIILEKTEHAPYIRRCGDFTWIDVWNGKRYFVHTRTGKIVNTGTWNQYAGTEFEEQTKVDGDHLRNSDGMITD